MLLYALASIEGSRDSENHVISPGHVFNIDADLGERLVDLGAARKATNEDAAVAKVSGKFIESVSDKAAADKAAADKAAADKAAAEQAAADKAAADKAAADKAAADKAAKATAAKNKTKAVAETSDDEL